ncbi:SET domain-containing protein [Neoconidiobolus thromboides FSU 785]|nr:SET domain-containing protein [Neoconidiobolus thromboides FSU 785]
MIIAKRDFKDTKQFLVKWKGYSKEFDTWEPEEALKGSEESITAFNTFVKFYYNHHFASKRQNQVLKEIEHPLLDLDLANPTLFVIPENIQKFMGILSKDEGPIITVINEIDDVGPPIDFDYINESVPMCEIPDKHYITGNLCKCKKACTIGKGGVCPCIKHNGGFIPYSDTGLLVLKPHMSIYECSSKCSCDDRCQFKVVQKGRKADVQIYKTEKKGWGVRALERIPKGSFICEYVGEIITTKEADKRAEKCEETGLNYLFNLDGEFGSVEETEYVIDGQYKGNLSHFFNHSCDPTLKVHPVFIENKYIGLHRLAFFANKDIDPLEELSIDYTGGIDHNLKNQENNKKVKYDNSESNLKHKCHCGAANCKGYYFQ